MTRGTLAVMASMALHGVVLAVALFMVSPQNIQLKRAPSLVQVGVKFSKPGAGAGKSSVRTIALPKIPQPKKANKIKSKHVSSRPLVPSRGLKKIKEVQAPAKNSDYPDGASGAGGAAEGLPGPSSGGLPKLVEGIDVAVPYPERARQFRVEGRVKMLLSISKMGQVKQIKILSGPGFGLRRAAQKLAKRLAFTPATDKSGAAIVAQVEHEVFFRLKDLSAKNI